MQRRWLRRVALVMTLALVAVAAFRPTPSHAATMANGWTEPVSLNNPASSWMANGCVSPPGYLSGQYHTGRDYWADIGTPVVAIGKGTVVQNGNFGQGYARALFIRHTAQDGTVFTVLYGHINSNLGAGAQVNAGDQVGTIAQLAEVGPHLHLGLFPGTNYPSSNWGNEPCANWPDTNGFVDPIPYLDAHVAPGGTPPPPPAPTIIAVKRTADPGGTRQVYAATNAAVTEGWWVPGGDGVHTSIVFQPSDGPVVGFDKVNLPDGTQAVYTAVPNGVYESWWRPGTGISTSKIVTGRTGVRQIIADNHYEGSQFVHRLYLLCQDGPFEIWWKDGGDGIHQNLIGSVPNPVAMAKSTAIDGTEQLYVATPTWGYELWWSPGTSVGAYAIINIPQGDIRALAKQNNSNGTQQLFTLTSTTVWRQSWGGGSLVTDALVSGQSNTRAIRKTVASGTDQLYLATADHVQEYYWNVPGTGASGGSELFRTQWNDITAIDKVSDGSIQELYTAAGAYVWETWWGSGSSPASNTLFRVTA